MSLKRSAEQIPGTPAQTNLTRGQLLRDKPRVGIILVNYKGVKDTIDCLQSLGQLSHPNIHVFVVDNHSEDHSLGTLQALENSPTPPVPFTLIASDQNLGYSGGNNLAIHAILTYNQNREQRLEEKAFSPSPAVEVGPLDNAPYDYIWLLNNDTTVDTHCLDYMLDEAALTGGLVGSLVLYPDKSYQQIGTQINWNTGSVRGYPERSLQDRMEVECLTGASMLIPISVIKRIGLLDESYFLYFEDAEYCIRAAEKRIPVTLALKARVYHYEGKTTGKHSLSTQYYYHRNRLKVLYQYASSGQKFKIWLYTSFRLLRTIVKSLLNPKPERQASLAVQKLAIKDFYQGVFGPCPHDLQAIQQLQTSQQQ